MSINRWMKKQNIVYLLSGICGHKKRWHPDTWILWHSSWHIHPTIWMNFENTMLSERSLSQTPHILQNFIYQFSSVQLLSRVWLFVTPWTAARQVSLSITNSRSSLKLMSIESVMPSNYLILCHPLLLRHQSQFQMSQFFTSGDQSVGVSASASVLPMNIQGWLKKMEEQGAK